ncbi:MAG TPA: class I adenylate-forming enzyme family protein [Burkholderiaceae bacterium]|nr:class I adenylate-forming enzyme family protein [Burkholderiaceae bacterium]
MQKILTLHDSQSSRAYYQSGIWQDDTFYTLAQRHAQERPDAFALRDATMRLTWREVVEWADSVAAALQQRGLRPGDRVGVWLPNVAHAVIVFLACSRNGYVCCPSLHQNYTVDEICTLLNRVQCRALFAMEGHGADGKQASIFERAADIRSLDALFSLTEYEGQSVPLPAGAEAFPGRQPPVAQEGPDLNPDKIVYLAFTSGTTGLPKGVMHSDNTLLANGRALAADWGQTTATRLLTLSPLSHHIATVALEQMLAVGLELIVTDNRRGAEYLDWIVETGATYLMGVPTHAMDILEAVRERGLARLGEVQTFYLSGAVIPREVAARYDALGVMPQNVYGMTENGSHCYTVPTDPQEALVGSCGRACIGYEIRLWKQDNPDEEAGPGEVGEVGGRGGILMLGYFGDQAATEGTFNRDGWFMSGDLGVFDQHGCLQVVGRKKDLIIRGGHNIHPARIEDLAMRHPDVERAAAFPVDDARLGEKVCLSIIPRAQAQIDPDDLLIHLAENGLSKYDMPEYFLSLEHFPLTASGKILKRDLVEQTRTGNLQPMPIRFVGHQKA